MAAGDGLVSMTPTSIAHSGTSASINADGGVDFTAVTSLSLNGVFTSDYDNYLIVIPSKHASGTVDLYARLRLSGSDATGSNYTAQYLFASGSATPSGARSSNIAYWFFGQTATVESADTIAIYGPALAQPTAARNVNASGASSATIQDVAGTHSLSTSYDGITLYPASGSITGTVHVFGYEE